MADILIIDDDEALRRAMRRILERAGHQVREAEDGARGLALYREQEADVVVTDLIMPEKEGIETIIELRESYPGVKILAMSGGGAVGPDGPLTDARFLGADASLPKPFSVEDLQDAIARLLLA
jgi:CheY-like chemotaxis protein